MYIILNMYISKFHDYFTIIIDNWYIEYNLWSNIFFSDYENVSRQTEKL